VKVERVAVLVGLGGLFPVVTRSGLHCAVITDAVLVDLAEEVAQRLLAQPPGPARSQLDATPVLLDDPSIGQRLGQLGQPV
jgi:hypothetical protein